MIGSVKQTESELRWQSRSRCLTESMKDVTLSVIIHSFISHARLLFEYERVVRHVITALDHSPDAAVVVVVYFSTVVQYMNTITPMIF